MIKQLLFVTATIFGLAFCAYTDVINGEIISDASDMSSNTKVEVFKSKSSSTVTKENDTYSMGDILFSEEQMRLQDEMAIFIQRRLLLPLMV